MAPGMQIGTENKEICCLLAPKIENHRYIGTRK